MKTDIQVNGYLGVDFSSPGLEKAGFIRACRALRQSGTDRFLPTLITSSRETYRRNLALIAKTIAEEGMEDWLPGIHLEGPFLSEEEGYRGAHSREWISPADSGYLEQLTEWADGKIKLLTMAAEKEGAARLCEQARGQCIAVALGHQNANSSQLDELHDAGARLLTHLGNALPPTIDRHRNTFLDALADDRYLASIITDGHHLPHALLKVILRSKGPERLIVVSDQAPIAGMPPGNYDTLGNKVRLEENGYLHNPEKGHMVGSSATLSDCIDHLRVNRLASKEEIQRMTEDNPSQLLKL